MKLTKNSTKKDLDLFLKPRIFCKPAEDYVVNDNLDQNINILDYLLEFPKKNELAAKWYGWLLDNAFHRLDVEVKEVLFNFLKVAKPILLKKIYDRHNSKMTSVEIEAYLGVILQEFPNSFKQLKK